MRDVNTIGWEQAALCDSWTNTPFPLSSFIWPDGPRRKWSVFLQNVRQAERRNKAKGDFIEG